MNRAHRPRRLRAVVLLAMCATACLSSCGETGKPAAAAPGPGTSSAAHAPRSTVTTPVPRASTAVPPVHGTQGGTTARRNIVFVLTDDLSTDLVPYMPHVQALMAEGMNFTNYTVTNSLCCPSRASILTGEFPHNTGVVSNEGPDGGWQGFARHGDERKSYAVSLERAGYRTGFLGKYLNGYDPATTYRNPAGWTTWRGVNEGGYGGYNYIVSADGRLVRHGHAGSDYLNTVLTSEGQSFITSASAAGAPFALEVAPFTPHAPYTPAPADRRTFAHLQAPRTPAFDTTPQNAPSWLAARSPLTPAQIATLDQDFLLRVEAVQSVDRMIMALQQTLRSTGQLANTVFVFSSDNGLHLGQYRMTAGKLTAFDTDVKVPLVVTGPGIAAGSTNADPVENIDLAPTFEQLAGAPVPSSVDGRSVVPLLYGDTGPWRTMALIEHGFTTPPPGDPDVQPTSAGRLGPYRAIRSVRFTYVEYANGESEYYDRTTDPYELDNIYGSLTQARVAELHSIVTGLATCAGATACWAAGRPAAGG